MLIQLRNQTNNSVQNCAKSMHNMSFGHVKTASAFKILSCGIAAMSLFAASSCVKEDEFIRPKTESPKDNGINVRVDTTQRQAYTYDVEV